MVFTFGTSTYLSSHDWMSPWVQIVETDASSWKQTRRYLIIIFDYTVLMGCLRKVSFVLDAWFLRDSSLRSEWPYFWEIVAGVSYISPNTVPHITKSHMALIQNPAYRRWSDESLPCLMIKNYIYCFKIMKRQEGYILLMTWTISQNGQGYLSPDEIKHNIYYSQGGKIANIGV